MENRVNERPGNFALAAMDKKRIKTAFNGKSNIMKKVKNVNDLRRLNNAYRSVCSTQEENWLPYSPRWFNQLYAFLNCNFWLPCHLCNTKFGGHEWMCSEGGSGICPKCSLKQYNETKTFS